MPKFASVIDLKKQQLLWAVQEYILPYLVKNMVSSIWQYKRKNDGVEMIYIVLSDKKSDEKRYLIYYDPELKKIYSSFEPLIFKELIARTVVKDADSLFKEIIDVLSSYLELIEENEINAKLESLASFPRHSNEMPSQLDNKLYFNNSSKLTSTYIDDHQDNQKKPYIQNVADLQQGKTESITKKESFSEAEINDIIKFKAGKYLPIPNDEMLQNALANLQPLVQKLSDFVFKAKLRADAQEKKLYIPIGEIHYSVPINLCEIILAMICNAYDINKLYLEISEREWSQNLLEVKQLVSHLGGDDSEIKSLAAESANAYLQSNNEIFERNELQRILTEYKVQSGNNVIISSNSSYLELLNQFFYWLHYERLESQLRVIESEMSLSSRKFIIYLALIKVPYMTLDISGFDSPLKQNLLNDKADTHDNLPQQLPHTYATILLSLRETHMKKEIKMYSQHVCSITGALHLCGLINDNELKDSFHIEPISLDCALDDSKNLLALNNFLYKDCYIKFTQQDKILIEKRNQEYKDLIKQGKIKSLDITTFKKELMILSTDDKGRTNPEVFYKRVIPLVRKCVMLHQQYNIAIISNNKSVLFKSVQDSEYQTKSLEPPKNDAVSKFAK